MSVSFALAMAIGVVGTSVIHLSKGVMKRGLVLMKERTGKAGSARGIYLVGVALNFTNPLWVIIANRFAPTVYYTSMYGLGLVALLVYARYRLAESISRRQFVGVAVIIVGTLVIGGLELRGGVATLYGASRRLLLWIAGGWLVAAPIAALMSKHVRLRMREALFGIAAGGLAALEAVVKGVSQTSASGSTFLPQTGANWVLFLVSFAGAAGAFGMIQWSFLRSCRASVMGAIYTTTYVALPLIITALVVPGMSVSIGGSIGIVVVAIGALLTISSSADHDPV